MNSEFSFKENFCIETKPERCGLIIFGASGDLTHRKLVPALFSLLQKKLLPESFFILGCARTPMTDVEFQKKVREAICGKFKSVEETMIDGFVSRCAYLSGDYSEMATYDAIRDRLKQLDREHGTGNRHIFYLSTPPSLYAPIVKNLGESKLASFSKKKEEYSRVVVEKPFGRDLTSATSLDKTFYRVLSEEQIYRIDHYLGKETIQNLLIFRFANTIFEPIWNRRYIDHVQITVAESIGVEHRAGYYEQAGLLRDMFQNHMLEMLSLVAMEPPAGFTARWVRDEKAKLVQAIRPFPQDNLDRWIVRGQYGAGEVEGKTTCSYREEHEVAPDSRIETFAAAKLFIDNWRWQGVPFYLRSGKRLKERISEIAIFFKSVPHSMFFPIPPEALSRNVLVMNVQPEEGISLTFEAKHPGARFCMGSLTMALDYRKVFGGDPPEAYERLLLDCMLGDQTLFIRRDAIEASWTLLDPVLEAWADKKIDDRLEVYRSGTWGPESAQSLIAQDNRSWREP